MTGPFSRRALIALVVGTLLSGALALALTGFGDELAERQSAGANSYSTSAIGHRGLVRLLERLDIPVDVSRFESSERAAGGLLVLAEPIVTDDESRKRLERLVAYGGDVLVVLPKWHGYATPSNPWIEHASYVPAVEVDAVLTTIDVTDAHVIRGAVASGWSAPENVHSLPDLHAPQLIQSAAFDERIVDHDGQILFGRKEHGLHQVWVLADPDALNNAGLRNPANARFIVGLLDRLRGHGPVVIDETMHGYARSPSVIRTLLSFPLVVATLQIVVCAILLAWAAMVRFGARRPAPPPIAPGKDFLIRNTAALLHYGGHHAEALRRYLQLAVADVRAKLHAPADASTEWLDRVREARAGTVPLAELERAVADPDLLPKHVVALADRIYRWRMEMTHGIDRGS